MNSIAATLVLAIATTPVAALAAGTCDGANPTVTSVSLRAISHTAHLNLYHVTATVTNLGGQAQPGDVLQFVDVVQYGGRLDDRGVPPLAPGESYTVSYIWPRSSDAGAWTSPLDFRVRPITAFQSSNCAARKSGGITV
jgi:hypothetical protein